MIIGLYVQNHIQTLQFSLAKSLRRKKNKIYCYSNNLLHVQYLRKNFKKVFGKIEYSDLNNFIYNTNVKKNFKKKQIFYEKKLQTTYLDVLASNRVHGIEYAIGSENHPRHQLSDIKKEKIFSGMNDFFDFWLKEIKKKKIQILISAEKEHYLVCKLTKIKFRAIERSRIQNYHYWAKSSNKKIPGIYKTFKKLSKNNKKYLDTNKILRRAYDAEYLRRKRNLENFQLSSFFKKGFLIFLKHIHTKLRTSKFNYCLTSKLKLQLRMWSHFRFLKKNCKNLRQLIKEKKKFVFFPLHTEPEPQILNNSPYFFFQEALIALISRYLPSDYYLVVKESLVGIGRRNDGFYKKLKKFKNVILLDPLDEGVNVIKKSKIVITISGTAGTEASILGIPVISLSPFNDYNILDSVYYLNDLTEIKNVIDLQLKNKKLMEKKFKKDGYNFLLALRKNSFDLEEYDHLIVSRIKEISEKNQETLYRSFMKSIK